MRPEEIRDMSDVEVAQAIGEASDELFKLRLRAGYEELENADRLRRLRRDIARLKTIKRERELSAAGEAKGN